MSGFSVSGCKDAVRVWGDGFFMGKCGFGSNDVNETRQMDSREGTAVVEKGFSSEFVQ